MSARTMRAVFIALPYESQRKQVHDAREELTRKVDAAEFLIIIRSAIRPKAINAGALGAHKRLAPAKNLVPLCGSLRRGERHETAELHTKMIHVRQAGSTSAVSQRWGH